MSWLQRKRSWELRSAGMMVWYDLRCFGWDVQMWWPRKSFFFWPRDNKMKQNTNIEHPKNSFGNSTSPCVPLSHRSDHKGSSSYYIMKSIEWMNEFWIHRWTSLKFNIVELQFSCWWWRVNRRYLAFSFLMKPAKGRSSTEPTCHRRVKIISFPMLQNCLYKTIPFNETESSITVCWAFSAAFSCCTYC